MKTKTVQRVLPDATFRGADKIFREDNAENSVLMKQYESKKTWQEKAKFLKFMGYLMIKGKKEE
jgi:hypothetical protein